MNSEISVYNAQQSEHDLIICECLSRIIDGELSEAESKIWHGHPVWFIDGNPIVGYSKQKNGIRLMFWSGIDFKEDALLAGSGKFKDASIFYQNSSEIVPEDLIRYLEKSRKIQWDYKNIVKRKGELIRIV